MKKLELCGVRFGRWTVVEKDLAKAKHTYWTCRCDCGTTRSVGASNLTSGASTSCGCFDLDQKRQRRLASWEPAFNALMKSYQIRAQKKELTWGLSPEHFFELTSSPCFWCGQAPNQLRVARSKTKWRSEFLYNGIDRVDSHVGYLKENCQTSCWPCNRMKGAMTSTVFQEHLQKILSHQARSK